MSRISALKARQILDSRGDPTIQVKVTTDENIVGIANIPSGVSTGSLEAFELRDEDISIFKGKSVHKAVINVLGPIAKIVIGQDTFNQIGIDHSMIEADGT